MPLVDLSKKLLEAAKLGQAETVQILLLNGALFTADWLGNTALHYAALNGHMELCKVLIRAGVTRDAHTKVNRTPLHLAAQEGHLPVVELLLSSGADVHATDMIGMSALHWAVQKGHVDIVHLLMQHGANAALPNKFSKTPLDIAVDIGQQDLFQLLQHWSLFSNDSTPVEEVTASEIAVYDAVERDLVNDVVDGTSVLRIPTAAVPSDITNGVQFSLAQPTFVTTAVPNVTPVEIDVTAALPYINGAEEQVTYSAVESCTADDTVPSSSLLASSSTTVMTTAVHGHTTASDTLTWLKMHGTAVDNTSLVTSMLSRGQMVVLTEAGKLLMNAVRPVTDITCRHLHEVCKSKNSDKTSTELDDSEPLSKKSKVTEDAAEHNEMTTEQLCCMACSNENMTCKHVLSKQELHRPS